MPACCRRSRVLGLAVNDRSGRVTAHDERVSHFTSTPAGPGVRRPRREHLPAVQSADQYAAPTSAPRPGDLRTREGAPPTGTAATATAWHRPDGLRAVRRWWRNMLARTARGGFATGVTGPRGRRRAASASARAKAAPPADHRPSTIGPIEAAQPRCPRPSASNRREESEHPEGGPGSWRRAALLSGATSARPVDGRGILSQPRLRSPASTGRRNGRPNRRVLQCDQTRHRWQRRATSAWWHGLCPGPGVQCPPAARFRRGRVHPKRPGGVRGAASTRRQGHRHTTPAGDRWAGYDIGARRRLVKDAAADGGEGHRRSRRGKGEHTEGGGGQRSGRGPTRIGSWFEAKTGSSRRPSVRHRAEDGGHREPADQFAIVDDASSSCPT